jgi:hypothetical protein
MTYRGHVFILNVLSLPLNIGNWQTMGFHQLIPGTCKVKLSCALLGTKPGKAKGGVEA